MGVEWTFKKGDLRRLTEITFQERGEAAVDEASHMVTWEKRSRWRNGQVQRL